MEPVPLIDLPLAKKREVLAYRDLEHGHIGTGPTCLAACGLGRPLCLIMCPSTRYCTHLRMRSRAVTSIRCNLRRRWTTMNFLRPRKSGCLCQGTVPFLAPAILCRQSGVADDPAVSFLLDQSVLGNQRVPTYLAAMNSRKSTCTMGLIKRCDSDSCPVCRAFSLCSCERLVSSVHIPYFRKLPVSATCTRRFACAQ